jgi:tRNA(Ile)-lysidine synthase
VENIKVYGNRIMTAAELVEHAVRSSILRISKDAPRLLAAVSGGADSTAMLLALAGLRTDASCYGSNGSNGSNDSNSMAGRFSLDCIHVNHNLRGDESRADAEFVLKLCEQLNVPCFIETVEEGAIEKKARDTGCGIEAAAREARHIIFQRAAARFSADKIIIAHNNDDLLENILIRLLRGSGPAGLAPLKEESGNILRPLLSVSRADILSYLALHNSAYRVDSSNRDESFFRNRVRLRLTPVLDANFPSWKKNLFQFAQTQSYVSDYLKDAALTKIHDNMGAFPLSREPGFPGFRYRSIPYGNASRPYNPLRVSGQALTINNFSSIAPLLQEEIIFNALNILENNIRNDKNDTAFFEPDIIIKKQIIPRRDVLRRALRKKKGADLGGGVIQFLGDAVVVSLKQPVLTEENFSLLIEHEGIFNYNNITIECCKNKNHGSDKKNNFFIARLPVVLYEADNNDFIIVGGEKKFAKKYKKTSGKSNLLLSARETSGIAAFILVVDDHPVIAQRKEPCPDNLQENEAYFYLFIPNSSLLATQISNQQRTISNE